MCCASFTWQKVLTVALVLILFSSCSLEYFDQGDSSTTSPEFVFYDANFTRTEDNKETIQMDVEQLEQYSESGLTFATEPNFTLYDSNQKVSVIGYCDILSADTDLDIYSFYGDVKIISYEHDATVEASNLRWSGNDELFSGPLEETVSILVVSESVSEGDLSEEKSTELYVEGKGFSASGLDFSYSFSGPVSGRIIEE